jgi:hypothetical protein
MSTFGRDADELARINRERELRKIGKGNEYPCAFCRRPIHAERLKAFGWFDHQRGEYRHVLICTGSKCQQQRRELEG